jgi:hypothetical protein
MTLECSNFKSHLTNVNVSYYVWHMNKVVAYGTKN